MPNLRYAWTRLEIVEGGAHDALGHGGLELLAELAHLHLEVGDDVQLLFGRQEVQARSVPMVDSRVSVGNKNYI